MRTYIDVDFILSRLQAQLDKHREEHKDDDGDYALFSTCLVPGCWEMRGSIRAAFMYYKHSAQDSIFLHENAKEWFYEFLLNQNLERDDPRIFIKLGRLDTSEQNLPVTTSVSLI